MNRVHVNPTRRRRPGQQPRAGSVQSTARNRRTCALSAAPPRPPSAGQGRLTPARRGPGRQGGDPAGHLTPPAGRTRGHQPGKLVAASPEKTRPPNRISQWPLTGPEFATTRQPTQTQPPPRRGRNPRAVRDSAMRGASPGAGPGRPRARRPAARRAGTLTPGASRSSRTACHLSPGPGGPAFWPARTTPSRSDPDIRGSPRSGPGFALTYAYAHLSRQNIRRSERPGLPRRSPAEPLRSRPFCTHTPWLWRPQTSTADGFSHGLAAARQGVVQPSTCAFRPPSTPCQFWLNCAACSSLSQPSCVSWMWVPSPDVVSLYTSVW